MPPPFFKCYILILRSTEEPLDLKLHRRVIKFLNTDLVTATLKNVFWWNSSFHSLFSWSVWKEKSFTDTVPLTPHLFFFFLVQPQNCLISGDLLEHKHLSEKERICRGQFYSPSQPCRQVIPVSFSLWKPLNWAALCCSTHRLLGETSSPPTN